MGSDTVRRDIGTSYATLTELIEELRDFKRTHRENPATLVAGVTARYEQFKSDIEADGVVMTDALKACMAELEHLLAYATLFVEGGTDASDS